VAGIAVAVVYRDKINDGLHDVLEDGLKKYDNDTGCQKAIDFMQTEVSDQLECLSELQYYIHTILVPFLLVLFLVFLVLVLVGATFSKKA